MELRVSKEHGLNPTVEVCWLCNKETGNLLLLGHNGGKEADRHTATGNVCDECNEKFKELVVALEVYEYDKPDRTGRFMWLPREMFNVDLTGNNYIYMPKEDFQQLLNRFEEAGKEKQE